MIKEEGAKTTLVIRRLRCEKCGKLHHELPDCVVPYKRHSAATIEDIVNVKTEETPCESGTIRRILWWWKIVGEYYINVMKSLAEKYKVGFHEPPLLLEIIRAAVNTNNWISAKTICTRSVLSTG
jgi:hypothetical protein